MGSPFTAKLDRSVGNRAPFTRAGLGVSEGGAVFWDKGLHWPWGDGVISELSCATPGWRPQTPEGSLVLERPHLVLELS